MNVRSTRAGTLTAFTSMFLGILAVFSFMGAASAAQQLLFAAVAAAFFFWRFRLGLTGVFDTEDGIVIRRMRRVPVMVPASAGPTVDFEKRLIAHRMIVRDNEGQRFPTDFLFAKPELEPRLELPENLTGPDPSAA